MPGCTICKTHHAEGRVVTDLDKIGVVSFVSILELEVSVIAIKGRTFRQVVEPKAIETCLSSLCLSASHSLSCANLNHLPFRARIELESTKGCPQSASAAYNNGKDTSVSQQFSP